MAVRRKFKIGILGCGAIGSRIAKSIRGELKNDCRLTGLYDCDRSKMTALAKSLNKRNIIKLKKACYHIFAKTSNS